VLGEGNNCCKGAKAAAGADPDNWFDCSKESIPLRTIASAQSFLSSAVGGGGGGRCSEAGCPTCPTCQGGGSGGGDARAERAASNSRSQSLFEPLQQEAKEGVVVAVVVRGEAGPGVAESSIPKEVVGDVEECPDVAVKYGDVELEVPGEEKDCCDGEEAAEVEDADNRWTS